MSNAAGAGISKQENEPLLRGPATIPVNDDVKDDFDPPGGGNSIHYVIRTYAAKLAYRCDCAISTVYGSQFVSMVINQRFLKALHNWVPLQQTFLYRGPAFLLLVANIAIHVETALEHIPLDIGFWTTFAFALPFVFNLMIDTFFWCTIDMPLAYVWDAIPSIIRVPGACMISTNDILHVNGDVVRYKEINYHFGMHLKGRIMMEPPGFNFFHTAGYAALPRVNCNLCNGWPGQVVFPRLMFPAAMVVLYGAAPFLLWAYQNDIPGHEHSHIPPVPWDLFFWDYGPTSQLYFYAWFAGACLVLGALILLAFKILLFALQIVNLVLLTFPRKALAYFWDRVLDDYRDQVLVHNLGNPNLPRTRCYVVKTTNLF